jgi:hypothetical protein
LERKSEPATASGNASWRARQNDCTQAKSEPAASGDASWRARQHECTQADVEAEEEHGHDVGAAQSPAGFEGKGVLATGFLVNDFTGRNLHEL